MLSLYQNIKKSDGKITNLDFLVQNQQNKKCFLCCMFLNKNRSANNPCILP